MGLINYLGNSKVIKRICQLLNVTDVQDGEGHSLVDENGIAIVSGGGGGSSTLADLTDVDVTGASDGDVLSFNGANWVDETLARVAMSGSYSDLSNVPTALSAFNNDSGFITSSVNNLTNYYLKSETYTKSEVNTLIGQITTISILVVQTLPQTGESNIIYLVPKSTAGSSNVYDEYIYVSGAWELIGDTTVDLSNYYTKSEVDALIPDDLADLNDDSTHRLVTDTEKTAWNGKSVVSANPATTTQTLSGLKIDGVGYDIPSGSGVQADWNETDTTSDAFIKNKPTIPAAQVNADWNASSGIAQILNKPTIPAAVAVKGNNEANYRTGNVNLTPANIGAIADSDRGLIVFKITRGSSVDLGTTGYWAAMCNSGGPAGGWWHIISTDWTGNDNKNWISQLAVATQDGNGVWWRRNNSGGTAITSSTWHRLAEGDANGSAASCNGYTLGKSVPSNAVFTDANVAQTNTTGNADYRVLFSVTADDTNRTEGARKGLLYWNPSSRRLFLGNGYGLYGNVSKAMTFQDGSDSNHAVCHAAYGGDGNQWGFFPNKDGWLYLGNAYRRWGQIYSTSGAINTSDRNEKKDILPLDDKARDFIMALNPVSYKFIDGKTGRTHYGMIAQDVEEEMSSLGMTDMDFAGFCKDQKMEEHYIENEDGTKTPDFKYIDDYRYGLRYEEFIAPMIKTIQIQQQEIEELKRRIEILEK